jgi:hypothetical protein
MKGGDKQSTPQHTLTKLLQRMMDLERKDARIANNKPKIIF